MHEPLDEEPSISHEDSRLLHLLTCPVCRSWAIGRLLGRSGGEGAGPEETRADYDEMFRSLEEKAPELIERVLSRRAEDERLLAEILRTPRGSRLKRIRGARFRSPGLLELLLERSHANQLTDPRLAGDLAVLATRLAALLDGDSSGPALARALCLDASSCRLLGDWRGAEERIGRAAPFLSASTDRAFYCRTVALLRWEQGRTDEAAALLHHAARLYVLDGLVEEEGACLALLGLLHSEGTELGSALSLLHEGWSAMDRDLRPLLALRSGLALALLLAEAREEERARGVLREVWRFHAQVKDPAEMVRAYWFEARVLTRLGDREEARHLLEAVFRRLLKEGSLAESGLAAIDLALGLAESGHLEEIRCLGLDLEAAFPETPALDLAQSALTDFFELAERSEPRLRDAALAIAATLLQTFRVLGLRVRPVPFA